MSASLTILGCRAGAPSAGAAASGYLLETARATLLVDCGPGVALALSALRAPAQLDALIVSHRHADHCADLLALAYGRRFPAALPQLPLFGPPDLREVLDGLDALFAIPSLPDLARPLAGAFAFQPVAGGAFQAGGLTVEALQTQHPVATLALRWPELGLAYTADAALTEGLVDFVAGARVLLCEATYPTADGHDLVGHGHMTAAQAGELARRAGAGRLVLTHLADPSSADETAARAAATYSGVTEIARPGLRVPLD